MELPLWFRCSSDELHSGVGSIVCVQTRAPETKRWWSEIQQSGEKAWKERLEFRVWGGAFYVHLMRLMSLGIDHHHRETVACGHMNATIHTFLRTGIEERLHSLFSKWVVCISWHLIPVTFTLTKVGGCHRKHQPSAELKTSVLSNTLEKAVHMRVGKRRSPGGLSRGIWCLQSDLHLDGWVDRQV